MPLGELFLKGTAWLGLLAWAASEWRRRSSPPASAGEREARGALTAGGLALLAHSALAFHLRYGWSQEAAQQDTARQTEAVTGLAFGGGLFVNYAFLALWAVEIFWWWRAPVAYRGRAAALDWSVRAFFLFMFVNGAIVFAHGPVRVVGTLATLAVAWAWYRGAGAEGVHG